MIDKHFTELSLLKREFLRSMVLVLLCWFHVKKFLRTEMA